MVFRTQTQTVYQIQTQKVFQTRMASQIRKVFRTQTQMVYQTQMVFQLFFRHLSHQGAFSFLLILLSLTAHFKICVCSNIVLGKQLILGKSLMNRTSFSHLGTLKLKNIRHGDSSKIIYLKHEL